MYDRHLESFIKVVESGSFIKAGEALFVSANAVAKQIDCLERDLGLKLLARSNHGVRPTEAGRIVYEGAKGLIAQAGAIVEQARMAAGATEGIVRLASSVMCPTSRIGRWWAEVATNHPSIKLETVPTRDDYRQFCEMLANLGDTVDTVVMIEPLPDLERYAANEARPLFESPCCVAVPVANPLAVKESLRLADLAGQRVYVPVRNHNATAERMRDEIEQAGLGIDVVDCLPYEIAAFNDAAREGALAINCLEHGEVHPAFVNVPLEGYAYRFCLVFPRDCRPALREFADAVCERAARG